MSGGDAQPGSGMKRIQRQRTKGWRMPEGAVYVGRPSRWGNPYRPTDLDLGWCGRSVRLTVNGVEIDTMGPTGAVYHFDLHARHELLRRPDWLTPLRGHDLACWCPLDQPCHADVLLALANA